MLQDKALLVSVIISQWTARKLDKRATQTVQDTHGTDSQVGNYTKKLLPGAKSLDRINSAAQTMRLFVYEQTLPWCMDGARILSSQNYIDFTKAFAKHKETFDEAVKVFVAEYATLRESARTKLGDLFRDGEYPTEEYLRTAYRCEAVFMPLPSVKDFRIELADSERQAFEAQMHNAETNATQECWQRLYEVVNKAAVRLADPTAQIRDSLIENVQELCRLLPKLNVTNNADLEAMTKAVELSVAKINPDVCRVAPNYRTQAADQLKEISERMSAFMGQQ